VIEAVASYGDDAAAIARTLTGWAAGPHLRLAGGTGPSYPSFTVEADSGRTGGSRWRGVLALYASPQGGPPCGVPELGHRSWPGLLCGALVFVDETAEDRPALDTLPGQVRDRVIWPRRVELAAAMKAPSIVVGLILS
jgi:hypothetical protein